MERLKDQAALSLGPQDQSADSGVGYVHLDSTRVLACGCPAVPGGKTGAPTGCGFTPKAPSGALKESLGGLCGGAKILTLTVNIDVIF